jgi:NAD(P)-dependent dehydrogenase (short-subunit alcohol dehydrogenase family)
VEYYTGKVAVITGAGGGIGRALAVDLAARGARLALSDQDGAAVAETARQCEQAGAHVRVDTLDVTQYQAMLDYTEAVAGEFGGVDMTFTVAGIIHTGTLLDSDIADCRRVLDVNYWGTVHTVKAFLPHLTKSSRAHIVNLSSAFGLLAVPRYSAYNSSKFAIRGLSEALRLEMTQGGHPVSVTCVYPGGVRTSIVRNGLYASTENAAAVAKHFERRIARTDPTTAATVILRGVQRRRARVLVGTDARVASAFVHLLGGAYQDVLPKIGRLLGLEA